MVDSRSFSWSGIWRTSKAAALVLTLAGLACSPATAIVSVDATPASLAISLVPESALETASTPQRLALIIDQTASLSAIALNALGNPVGATGVVWTSSQPAVASVSADGVVVALAVGTTEIVAAVNGIAATLEVVVSEQPQ